VLEKTTLSRVYARKQQFPVVWEINAETRESLINSFKDLAYALAQSKEQKEELKFIQNIQNLGEKEKQFIFFVKRHLKNKGNWLLIYDNVETFSKIKDYFPQDPQIWGSGRVIITTRDNNIVNTNYIKAENVIHIEELSQSQTLTLFSKILYNCEPSQLLKEQKEKALNLLHHIPPFPLDISAAAYYIKNTKITYKEYLRRINSYSETFENFQETLIKESSNYTKTRYGIIISSLEKIIDIRPEYKELLLYICLLDSQNIPKELLEACKENTVIEQFIYNLKKYSLISKLNLKSNFSTYFSVHRSTQAIILIYLKSNLKLEEYKKFLTNISISFMNYLDSIISNEDFVKMPLLIAHSEKFLSHDRLLDDDTSILISGKLGDIYCYLANYQKARELLESTYHRSKSKNSPSIGLVLLNLGDVYREQGNYEKSIKVLNETLLIFKHNFHKFYNEYALTLGSLGYAYGSAGDYEMAKISLEKSLLIYKSNFNENSLRVAWMLARLGNIYKELGDYNKSIITLEQSFSIYKKYFILDHVRIAWIQAYLGDAYRMQGNYNKAKILLEQSFLTSKKHLTEAHVKTAWISIYLGNVYKELKDYKKAKELLLKGLVIYKQHYTKDHFEIAELLKDIGNIYLLDNKLLIAEDYYNRSVSIFKKNNHPKLYLVYEKLAYLYMQKSHQAKVRGHIQEFQIFEKKTLRYLQNALNIVTANFPENSPHKVKIQEKLKSIDAKFT
jgi:tetratricopeptide (TPR) repeat protein